MPYIKQEDRDRLVIGDEAKTAGELNYIISKEIMSYLHRKGISYAHLNEVIGVLECAKLELYRRVVAEYEDVKIAENGDVFAK